jgi:hypothetical protein
LIDWDDVGQNQKKWAIVSLSAGKFLLKLQKVQVGGLFWL